MNLRITLQLTQAEYTALLLLATQKNLWTAGESAAVAAATAARSIVADALADKEQQLRDVQVVDLDDDRLKGGAW